MTKFTALAVRHYLLAAALFCLLVGFWAVVGAALVKKLFGYNVDFLFYFWAGMVYQPWLFHLKKRRKELNHG